MRKSRMAFKFPLFWKKRFLCIPFGKSAESTHAKHPALGGKKKQLFVLVSGCRTSLE
jgi:hypothetical protein